MSFYKFLAKYFILSALASYLIFTGNKLTTSGCILQNSDGDRSEELMERVIDRFILTPFVLLQGVVVVGFD